VPQDDPTVNPRTLLNELFQCAIERADPAQHLARYLPTPPTGQVCVVGAGKAAAAMAAALEHAWPGPIAGLVLVPYGHAVPCRQIQVIEAGHPVPDAAGMSGARRILTLAQGLGTSDLLLCLLSGGGSALLTLPLPGLSLAEKQTLTRQLLASGATISEINTVRKHLSAIKGGRLATAAYPAASHSLLVSDVPGDDPAVIASGPTTADPTTRTQAQQIIAHFALNLPPPIAAVLASETAESPKPGADALSRSDTCIIASPKEVLAAAAALARAQGFVVINLGDRVEGPARQVARDQARKLRELINGRTDSAPVLILPGGETTVEVKGRGCGGRNLEYLLALALELRSLPDTWAIACETDGIDGCSQAAGAILTPDTLARADSAGLDASACLADNDAGGFFQRLGDTVITGPTRTNVNDFRAIACFVPTG
jgi:hydroxypyruvate reductase